MPKCLFSVILITLSVTLVMLIQIAHRFMYFSVDQPAQLFLFFISQLLK